MILEMMKFGQEIARRTDEDYGRRLDNLGGLVVDLAQKIGVDERVGAVA